MDPDAKNIMTIPRVAHMIATNFFGGPEKQIVEHAKRIDPANFDFLLISFVERGGPNELLQRAREAGIESRGLVTGNPFHPGVIRDLARLLKRERIALLCAHGYKSNVIGRIATRLVGIPLLASSRGWTSENRKVRIYEALDRWFLRRADHVVCVSEGQKKKLLAAGVREDRISVIFNAIDADGSGTEGTPLLRREFGFGEKVVVVVSGGRLSPEKNHVGLIDAAKIVHARDPSVRFVVFGDGFLRKQLEERISRAELQEIFLLPGFRRDFARLLRDADIFVLPSLTEGLPNVVLEAYAAAKPVVATAVGGTPEVVRHGETGFLLEADDTEALAAHILRLAKEPDLRRRLGENGNAFVRREFRFDRQSAMYDAVYRRLLPRDREGNPT